MSPQYQEIESVSSFLWHSGAGAVGKKPRYSSKDWRHVQILTHEDMLQGFDHLTSFAVQDELVEKKRHERNNLSAINLPLLLKVIRHDMVMWASREPAVSGD